MSRYSYSSSYPSYRSSIRYDYSEPLSYYGYGSRGYPSSSYYSTIWPVHASYPSYASRVASRYYDPYYVSPYDSRSTYYGYGRYSGLYSPYAYRSYYY